MKFGDMVRQQRVAMGMSQRELAERVGVSVNTIYYIENRKHDPSLSIAVTVCKLLKIPAVILFNP